MKLASNMNNEIEYWNGHFSFGQLFEMQFTMNFLEDQWIIWMLD